jgi:hypothetical protein
LAICAAIFEPRAVAGHVVAAVDRGGDKVIGVAVAQLTCAHEQSRASRR